MITAEIKINGKLMAEMSATNIGRAKGRGECRWYRLDCGCKLKHDRTKGYLVLLIKMAGHNYFTGKCKRINQP